MHVQHAFIAVLLYKSAVDLVIMLCHPRDTVEEEVTEGRSLADGFDCHTVK